MEDRAYLEGQILQMMENGKSMKDTIIALKITKGQWRSIMRPFCQKNGIELQFHTINAFLRRPKVKKLHEKGYSNSEICRELRVGIATLYADLRYLYPEEVCEDRRGGITKEEIDRFIENHPVGSSLNVIREYISADGHHFKRSYRTTITGRYKHFCTTAIGINPRWADVVVFNRGE